MSSNRSLFTLQGGSLKQRLAVLAGLVLIAALFAAELGLTHLFRLHVEKREQAELTDHFNQLVINLQVSQAGKPKLSRDLSNPRFAKPLGGLYWQIFDPHGKSLLKSRSMWEFSFKADQLTSAGPILRHNKIDADEGNRAFAVYQIVSLDTATGKHQYLLVVGVDNEEIQTAVADFSQELGWSLAGLALVLITMLFVQIYIGLLPLERLRREIVQLQEGQRQQLTGNYPREVLPVISEINDFIREREETAIKARERAANLAHGFKTPLTVLSGEVRKLEEKKQQDHAIAIRMQIATMNRFVERELTRAKLQAVSSRKHEKTNISAAVGKVIDTLDQLPTTGAITWQVDIPQSLDVQMERSDFMEVCGNLLENAVKWSQKNIAVRAEIEKNNVAIIEIYDDGPGVEPEKWEAIFRRGNRLDSATPGSGLGLAIVDDIMKTYGGVLSPFQSPLGGLGIRLMFR